MQIRDQRLAAEASLEVLEARLASSERRQQPTARHAGSVSPTEDSLASRQMGETACIPREEEEGTAPMPDTSSVDDHGALVRGDGEKSPDAD